LQQFLQDSFPDFKRHDPSRTFEKRLGFQGERPRGRELSGGRSVAVIVYPCEEKLSISVETEDRTEARSFYLVLAFEKF